MKGFMIIGVLNLDSFIMGSFFIFPKRSDNKIENFKKYYKKIWREADTSSSRTLLLKGINIKSSTLISLQSQQKGEVLSQLLKVS